MGHYTEFSITQMIGIEWNEFCIHLANYIDFPEDFFTTGTYESPVKWSTHEEDVAEAMRETGAKHVTLHGIEKRGDVWDKEFHLLKDGTVRVLLFKYELVRSETSTVKIFKKETK